jgi:hypothetical protein
MVEDKNKRWWTEYSQLNAAYALCAKAVTGLGLKNTELWRGTSDQYKDSFRDDEIGLLSIDGNHGPQAVLDAKNYLRKVQRGGLIACDDTEWTEGGVYYVRQAIDWLRDNGCTFLDIVDGCTMLQKAA